MKNIAYMDGQNFYMGTAKSDPVWHVDLKRFRVFLREKYRVEVAYYYLGVVQEGLAYERLYEEIQIAGFVLVFRQHTAAMVGTKKGNVDSDIIFSIMKRLYLREEFDKIVLVSGDGDYKPLVDFLIEQERFEKILFPNKRFASSLYKNIGAPYFASLAEEDTKRKIEAMKKAP